MIEAYTHKSIQAELTNAARWSQVRLGGILFARPSSDIAKREIVPNLDYFHHRSANTVHFFCAGYGAYWRPKDYPDSQVATSVGGTTWHFSNSCFDRLRRDIEGVTKWRYSGGADLVLMNVQVSHPSPVVLDYGSAVCFRLNTMIATGVITGAEMFFEEIFRFGEDYQGSDSVVDFLRAPESDLPRLVPANIGVLTERMNAAWPRGDYAEVVHASASIFETMAKDVVGTDTVQDQTLGSFFAKYRKCSSLPPDKLDQILEVYNQRSATPLAAHGSTRTPGISREVAANIMRNTRDFVRLEYQAWAVRVGGASV